MSSQQKLEQELEEGSNIPISERRGRESGVEKERGNQCVFPLNLFWGSPGALRLVLVSEVPNTRKTSIGDKNDDCGVSVGVVGRVRNGFHMRWRNLCFIPLIFLVRSAGAVLTCSGVLAIIRWGPENCTNNLSLSVSCRLSNVIRTKRLCGLRG